MPLIVSVMADCAEDFAVLVERVAARDEVAGIELNVSCPNVHSGLIVGEQPSETEALMKALRPLTPKPLIVKLTPNVANPHEVAVAAEAGGADSVSMINTVKAAAIDPRLEPGLARCRSRRTLRSGSEADRPGPGADGFVGGRDSGDRHGRNQLTPSPPSSSSSPVQG